MGLPWTCGPVGKSLLIYTPRHLSLDEVCIVCTYRCVNLTSLSKLDFEYIKVYMGQLGS